MEPKLIIQYVKTNQCLLVFSSYESWWVLNLLKIRECTVMLNQSAGEEKYLLLNQYLIIFSTAFLSTFRLL